MSSGSCGKFDTRSLVLSYHSRVRRRSTGLRPKADVWAYEREWRMFLPLSRAVEVKHIGATLLHLFDFPADCVSEVILGAKCSSAIEAALLSTVAVFQSTPVVYRCGIDDVDYKIIRKVA